MHITISKVRLQDPLCNTRNLIPHYVSTYMEKEPPKKHVYICVEVNQLQDIEKEKQTNKKPKEKTNTILIHLYTLVQVIDCKQKKWEKMLTLFPPGNSDLGCCHIPGARVACVPRLRSPGAEGAGSMWQAVNPQNGPRVFFPSAEALTSRYRQEKLRPWS